MATTTTTTTHANGIGLAQTKRNSRSYLQSQSSTAWKRASSPVAEAYADLVGPGANIGVLAGRKAGDRTSMGQYIDNRRRTQLYEDQFRYKDNEAGSVRERVQRESPVIAELRTNVIIKDEFTLVSDLSYHLAQRYTRPDSSIMIKIDHSACLALGGTFDPCYILSITAVPSQMGPTMNKRNAALVQSFMADILSVPSDRGIVKFQPIEECNFAMNGVTMLGEIERLEKHQGDDAGGLTVRRAVTNTSCKSFNSKTYPRIDSTDVKTPNGTPATVSATNGRSLSREQKRRSQTSPPLASAIPNVFELPAMSGLSGVSGISGDERPSTSHGTYAAENGLRMNGISKEDLSRIANGRPKTIGARPSDEAEDEPMPIPSFQRRGSTQSQRSNRFSLKPEQKSTASIKDSRAVGNDRPKSGPPPRTSQGDAYVNNVAATPRTEQKYDPKIDARASEKNRQLDSKDTAANTAKRRSTVTATPKMPPPPPVPESKTKEPKVGKRKSFLSAFRRSAAA
ncbi:hypothetical protein EJ03DRAFT_340057 [Teratosphaeria nubilosa]|uniref:L-dopachrome isomerase n=1 Tax=Teratosphaeria nubilosa TaxID=161662 RepID=A0A6G1KTX0_9PEZI|nr:hypothetical protein EJ03DRAFT_340057 [Teratosphaeria nubilosa]